MRPPPLVRVVSAIIAASGALGVVLTFLSMARFAPMRFLLPVRALPVLVIWGVVLAIGIWLWHGSRRSRIAATALLVSQVPIVVADGFTYWWHVPAQVAVHLQRISGQLLVGVDQDKTGSSLIST